MKYLELCPDLLNLRGQFYPTGHIVAMFPGEEAARTAGQALVAGGVDAAELSLITPEKMMGDVARTVGSGDMPLPSAGTEGDTIRRFTHLAAQGQWALLIHAPDNEAAERVMKALEDHRPSHAQRYRRLVIEDLA